MRALNASHAPIETAVYPPPNNQSNILKFSSPQKAILIIDDNASFRDALSDILQSVFGKITIYTAVNGSEGLQIFQAHKHQIALIFLDIEMPIMNGPKTHKKLQQLAPQVKVIVSSSLSYTEATSCFEEQTLPAFLRKPFKLTTLLNVLHSEIQSIMDQATHVSFKNALMDWDDDGGAIGSEVTRMS